MYSAERSDKLIKILQKLLKKDRMRYEATLKKIERLCGTLGVYVISDEVYKDLIYVRKNYLIQGEKVVTVNSFSKTYAMCGFRT